MTRPRDELDELTLLRARRGERAACARLVATYQPAVFALLGRMLGAHGKQALVEDLAQETFLRAFRALPGWDPGGPARLSTWLLTIATRLCMNELERRVPEPVADLESLDEAAFAEAADRVLDRKRMAEAIRVAVAGLPHGYRAVFLLRELHGLEYDEIGRALELDPGTVKSRLSRARAALRKALAEVHDG